MVGQLLGLIVHVFGKWLDSLVATCKFDNDGCICQNSQASIDNDKQESQMELDGSFSIDHCTLDDDPLQLYDCQ